MTIPRNLIIPTLFTQKRCLVFNNYRLISFPLCSYIITIKTLSYNSRYWPHCKRKQNIERLWTESRFSTRAGMKEPFRYRMRYMMFRYGTIMKNLTYLGSWNYELAATMSVNQNKKAERKLLRYLMTDKNDRASSACTVPIHDGPNS